MKPLALLLLAASLLAACGKKGPPEPPGPPDQITYPKLYPTTLNKPDGSEYLKSLNIG